jgi:hypothetical protein
MQELRRGFACSEAGFETLLHERLVRWFGFREVGVRLSHSLFEAGLQLYCRRETLKRASRTFRRTVSLQGLGSDATVAPGKEGGANLLFGAS